MGRPRKQIDDRQDPPVPTTHNQEPSVAPEIFLVLYRAMKEAKRRKDEAAAGFAAAKARAKEAGVDMNALKIMEHLSGLDDAEADIRMRQTMRYCEWVGMPFAVQTDMFAQLGNNMIATKLAAEHQEWEAEQSGYNAGKAGDSVDNCPHNPGTALAERWRVGFRDGAEMASSLKKPASDDGLAAS